MKIQPYIEKLNASNEFKTFREKYKDAFLAAGFFVIDFEMGNHIHQIDYYIPSAKKFAAFNLDKKVSLQILDSMVEKSPERLEMDVRIDLEALKGILEDEMRNRNITEEIKKIIAVIQSVKGKKIWNVNSVLSGMEILKAHVEDESKTVLKMEKTSFSDIMKKIPMDQLKAAAGQMGGAQTQPQEEEQDQEENPEEAMKELKKLDDLENRISKEKERLKKKVIEDEKKNSKAEGKSAPLEKSAGIVKSKKK